MLRHLIHGDTLPALPCFPELSNILREVCTHCSFHNLTVQFFQPLASRLTSTIPVKLVLLSCFKFTDHLVLLSPHLHRLTRFSNPMSSKFSLLLTTKIFLTWSFTHLFLSLVVFTGSCSLLVHVNEYMVLFSLNHVSCDPYIRASYPHENPSVQSPSLCGLYF